MTIVALFHFSSYRTFKDYYQNQQHYFLEYVSYNRFVELMRAGNLLLTLFMRHKRLALTQGQDSFFGSITLIIRQNPLNTLHHEFAYQSQRRKPLLVNSLDLS